MPKFWQDPETHLRWHYGSGITVGAATVWPQLICGLLATFLQPGVNPNRHDCSNSQLKPLSKYKPKFPGAVGPEDVL